MYMMTCGSECKWFSTHAEKADAATNQSARERRLYSKKIHTHNEQRTEREREGGREGEREKERERERERKGRNTRERKRRKERKKAET